MWQDQALAHAKEDAPKEACGLVYIFRGKEKYVKSKNISSNPTEQFTLDPLVWAQTENKGEITGIFHSHPHCSPKPSKADIISANRLKVTWYIVNPESEEWETYRPIQKTDLLGREWVWAVSDCYTLVRDWYKEQGIILFDLPRPDENTFDQIAFFDVHWRKEGRGFRELKFDEKLKEGDVLLFSLGSSILNHVGVYLNQGKILHHIQTRLSCRDDYSEYLQKCTGRRLRHVAHD